MALTLGSLALALKVEAFVVEVLALALVFLLTSLLSGLVL